MLSKEPPKPNYKLFHVFGATGGLTVVSSVPDIFIIVFQVFLHLRLSSFHKMSEEQAV